jgi:hypothetical protein
MLLSSLRKYFVMIRLAVALIWLATVTNAAVAQGNSSTLFGGERISNPGPGPTFGASAGTEILRHRGPTGSPCLTVSGNARPHAMSPNVYDHVISVQNSCAQSVTIRVCYYKSQDCLPMEIPGGERKEAILGTLPAVKDFRFEFREKF